ncbi:hypothetical protein AAG604_14720 [Citromicrobium bathyomarinum]
MKRACIFTIEGEGNPINLSKKLESRGYSVELIELESELFEEYRNCDPNELPAAIRSKIAAADLVIFYLTEAFCSEGGFEGFAQCAAGAGADIVGVWPPGSSTRELPKTLSDFGASSISEDSDDLDTTISGSKDQWELPDQSPAEAAEKEHQKKC